MDLQTIIIIVIVIIILFIIIGSTLSKGSSDESWKSTLKSEHRKVLNSPASSQKLVDLDKLMDFYLKNSKVKGETMGERLKNAGKLFNRSDYNNIWEAHKLRNRLVHEVGISQNSKELELNIQNLSKIISKL